MKMKLVNADKLVVGKPEHTVTVADSAENEQTHGPWDRL